ncbi:9-cis-epoxycarotenoid dioxygenase [Asimina triloba]
MDRRPLLLIPLVTIVAVCLDSRSTVISKLGDDEFSHMLVCVLKENDVSTDGVLFDTGTRTALTYILCSDSERDFMFCHNPRIDMLLKDSKLYLKELQHPLPKTADPAVQIFDNFAPIDKHPIEHDLPILGRIPPSLYVCKDANPLFEPSAGHHLFNGEPEEHPL